MHLPPLSTKLQLIACLQRFLDQKAWALLARRQIAEPRFIPLPNDRGFSLRNECPDTWIARLQARIPAAVVAVQMRVDDQIQRTGAKLVCDQRQGLLGMRDIAGVDERTVLCS